MRLVIQLLSLLFTSSLFAQNCPEKIHEGDGTYYGSIAGTSSGNCSLPIADNDFLYAALNTADYNGSQSCGACIEVTGPNGKITVRVVDRCPECKEGDVDLSESAFAQIADVIDGRVPISWKFVPCDRQTKNIKINFKEGSSQYWTAIQFRDINFAIKSMEYETNTGWKSVNRALFNFFIEEDGITSPMHLRVTSVHDEQLVFENITVDLLNDYDTGKQFKKEVNCETTPVIDPPITGPSIETDEEKDSTIFVYPNPATTVFYIHTFAKKAYQLFDTKGRLVRSGVITSRTEPIFVSGLSKGLYYVSIENNMMPLILR